MSLISGQNYPLVSVITVVYNGEEHIEQTIYSVLFQTYQNMEYIIVDGGSEDGTLDIINKYKEQVTKYVSEPDDGIADAMNKGLALATGDYVLFLNADDYLRDDRSLEDALGFLEQSTDILACRIQFGKKLKTHQPRGFNFWTRFKTGVYHQGALCRRKLINELGGFDKQFRIVMDYDFFLRAYQAGAILDKAPVTLAVMRDVGISSRRDWENLKIRFEEEKKVHQKNCRSSSMRVLYKLYWLLYPPYRKLSYLTGGGRWFFLRYSDNARSRPL